MRTRNLIALIFSLSFLLVGGIVLVGHQMGIFRYFFSARGWDCVETPDAQPCLIDEAVTNARQVKHPFVRARLLTQAAHAKAPPRPSGSSDDDYYPRHSTALFDEAVDTASGVDALDMRIMIIATAAAGLTEAGYQRGPRLFESLVWLVLDDGPGNSPTAMMPGPESGKSKSLVRIARAQAASGDLGGARNTTTRQSTDLGRVKSLTEIAEVLAMQGDTAAASELINEALASLGKLPDRAAADTAAARAAGVLARTGRVGEALSLAAQPNDMQTRGAAHMRIVEALADTGRLAEAEEALSRIENSTGRSQGLWQLATARARAGDIAGAKALLKDIKMPLALHQAVGDIAGFQAVAGDLKGALDDIADLPEGFMRDRGLQIVVESLIDAGRLTEAEDILAGFGNDALWGYVAVKLAGARATAGQIESALTLARTAPDPAIRAEALLAVAEAIQGGGQASTQPQ